MTLTTSASAKNPPARVTIPLDSGWHFRQVPSSSSSSASASASPIPNPHEWRPVAHFPTTIHQDLLHHQLIPDPFIGTNERAVQWIGEASWAYRTTFRTPAAAQPATQAQLVLAGLDTYATVRVNGAVVLQTDNMFVAHAADVAAHLRPVGEENTLEIEFDSAWRRGQALVKDFPEHKWGCWNGDVSRLAVRKAQYHWGWDWGPMLMTCGPWRPVTLEIWALRIDDFAVQQTVDTSGPVPTATVTVSAAVTSATDASRNTSIAVTISHGSFSDTLPLTSANNAVFSIPNPQLWYPARYGAQPLYTVTAELSSASGHVLDRVTKRIGLRKAELVQEPLADQPGTSFFFRVNDIPVFCGGSNWIPSDNFLPRVTPAKYRDWLELLVRSNQSMVRVWGGGVYEDDAFYDTCDELGILVWQDFMFACGNYPTWPGLLASIDTEARTNVKRLRHHASIVIWAGNNEDYSYRESVGLTYEPQNTDAESWLKTDFPARYIYEKILADACAELIPDTAYHFGSPYGGVDTSDQTVGDIHQWNVWHGTQRRYQDFDQLVGRFVSEFGMEAFPHIKTIDALLPRGAADADRFSQSATLDFHNKAEGHERRLALYLVENIRYELDPLEAYIYATQLMQAECLASAYRLWKRQWRGPQREYCAGALVWQINDCWPTMSWSIVDYFLRPKLAYYTIKREMNDISVGMKREDITGDDGKVRTEVQIWGSNLSVAAIKGKYTVKAYDVESGEEVHVFPETEITLPENRSTEMAALDVPGTAGRTVMATFLAVDDVQIARYVNWPEPLKYLHLQQPKKLTVVLSEDGKKVEVSADVPVKGLALECEDEGVVFADNCVDIVPGEVVTVAVEGASASSIITTRFLNMK